MGTRKYDKLAIEPFGRHLIESGDLDPIYIALRDVGWDDRRLKRWLVAYWSFYHAGAACWLSEWEGATFWKHLEAGAANAEPAPTGERWPRGHERRHFRGAAAVKAVLSYKAQHDTPEDMVDYMIGTSYGVDEHFSSMAERAKQHALYGPWISFKVGDMLERVLECRIKFDNATVFMFDTPTEAALMVWRLKAGFSPGVAPRDKPKAIQQVVDYLKTVLGDLKAPPTFERTIDLQEVETVLCKWKSHMGGSYPINNDIDEITHGLAPWASACESAQEFLVAMPKRREYAPA